MKTSEKFKKNIELLKKCQALNPKDDDDLMMDWFDDKYNKAVDNENRKLLQLRIKKMDSL